ncbi:MULTISPECIES: M20 family metallopeptidase [unclassified Variovorax]|uniref:M20 family metallopeptidase n=1 Tax=unclassified Variovorax TaxID=663243 RepID=UPI003F466977
MSRINAIDGARSALRNGRYEAVLTQRVAIQTVSQDPQKQSQLHAYLAQLCADLEPLGFKCEVHPNPNPAGGPILVASRHEADNLKTLLCYGHADVVVGMDDQWTNGRSPWRLAREGDRLYGRGTADNKGQHTLVLLALEEVMRARGQRLGYNVKLLIDTCEETGSIGLREFCEEHRDMLKADFLIASDGPRISVDQPTFYLGTRGVYSFDLECNLREGGLHPGNWGGIIANPAVLLSHAIAALIEVNGRVAARGVLPHNVPASVGAALRDCRIEPGPGAPAVDRNWGEPGLSPEERLFGWAALEVLAMGAGNPEKAVNAIPGKAVARCQIRYTVDCDHHGFLGAIQARLAAVGLTQVRARHTPERGAFPATRLDPAHPFAVWAGASVQETLGIKPSIMPNAGGTLPNDCFAVVLGLPTLWVSHSYPGCCQHAPDEHVLLPLIDDGLAMMAGLFWDLSEYASVSRTTT